MRFTPVTLEPRVDIIRRIADGSECNLAALYTGLHCGTHVDAPLHFIDKGMPIDMLPLTLLSASAR